MVTSWNIAAVSKLTEFREQNLDYLYRVEVNTYIVESLHLMYMDTPKAGGTSIKTRLAQLEAGYEPPNDSYSHESAAEMYIHDKAVNPLKSVADYDDGLQEEILFSSAWRRFCVVRNPYARLFSAWFSKILLRQPGYLRTLPGYELPDVITCTSDIYTAFERFVAYLGKKGCNSNPHWDRQVLLLFHGTLQWDRIFRFENLQEELDGAANLFGGQHITLGRLNLSGFAPNWAKIAPSTRDLIATLYAEDFDAYGYGKEPPNDVSGVDLLPVYINAVVMRNERIAQLIERSERQVMKNEAQLAENTAQRTENTALQARNSELEAQISALKQELEIRLSAIHKLENSISWKITRPLRTLRRVING